MAEPITKTELVERLKAGSVLEHIEWAKRGGWWIDNKRVNRRVVQSLMDKKQLKRIKSENGLKEYIWKGNSNAENT